MDVPEPFKRYVVTRGWGIRTRFGHLLIDCCSYRKKDAIAKFLGDTPVKSWRWWRVARGVRAVRIEVTE